MARSCSACCSALVRYVAIVRGLTRRAARERRHEGSRAAMPPAVLSSVALAGLVTIGPMPVLGVLKTSWHAVFER